VVCWLAGSFLPSSPSNPLYRCGSFLPRVPHLPFLILDRKGRGRLLRTDTTADEAEHEGGISGDLRRNLELCRDGISRCRRCSFERSRNEPSKAVAVSHMSAMFMVYSSNRLAALTKTKDDRIHADDNRSTAHARRHSISHLVHGRSHHAEGVTFVVSGAPFLHSNREEVSNAT
jgi:hypothetical protein